MKLIKYKLIFCFFLFFENINAAVESKIVIKVDDKIITNYEIKNKINTELLLRNLDVNQVNIDRMKNLAVQELINLRVKQKEINRFNNSIDVESIDITSQLIKISNGNVEELKKKFSQYNLNFDVFVKELKIQAAWQRIIFILFNNKVKINEDEILEEVKIIKKDRSEIKKYDLSEIEVSFSTRDEKEKKINLIKEQIQEKGFEQTVAIYSESDTAINKGKLGFVSEESLSENIYENLKDLNEGEVSKPIINVNKILFLKINKIKISKNDDLNITQLKNDLINKKKNNLFILYSQSHLSKLKNSSYIEFR